MDATFVWKLSKLGRIGSSRLRFDDDFIDRLNYQYTGVLMFLFIGLIGIRQYVGKPIQCWIPQEFTRGWEEYAENYCWVSNTYFAPVENRLPPVPDRELLLIGYYQWAPIVMAVQAMAFYLPCLIWRLFMSQSGFNVRRILQMACDSNVLLPEHTMKNVRFIARYIEGCIYRQWDRRRRKVGDGFAPTSYSGLAGGGAVTGYPQQPQHYHHLHHHHPCVGQSPAYTYAPGSHGNREIGFIVDGSRRPATHSPKNESRGNGGAPSVEYHTSRANLPLRREKSFFARLRPRLSMSSGLSSWGKTGKKAAGKLDPFESDPNLGRSGATGGPLQGSGSCSDMHPMLDQHKSAVGEDSRRLHPSQRDKGGRLCCPAAGLTGSKITVPVTSPGGGSQCGCLGKKHGNFLVVLYFFTKLLYLTNIIGQLYMMEKFVGHSYTFYGIRVLIDLVQGHEWFHSGNFPRVTFCDFEAKKLGKNHMYTLQCVLPLNMFLEKIYIFLWFWHCMLGLLTISSFIVWFYRMGFPQRRVKFIRKYLKIMSVLRDTDKAASRRFVENYLRPDGVFLIRLISINVGDLMAGDLACELWHIYRHRRHQEMELGQKFLDASNAAAAAASAAGDFLVNSSGAGPGFELSFLDSRDKSTRPPSGVHASAPLHSSNAGNNLGSNNDDSIV